MSPSVLPLQERAVEAALAMQAARLAAAGEKPQEDTAQSETTRMD